MRSKKIPAARAAGEGGMVERIKVTRLCRIHARSCGRNSCRLPNNYVRNLRIILLSISEWYYGRVLLPEIVATLVGFSLIVQGRPIHRCLRGELTEIMNPSRNRYEYTILTKEDGYTGRSSKPIRVTKGSEVRFTIHGRSLYIIDMDGKTQRLRYAVHLTSSAPAPKRKQRGDIQHKLNSAAHGVLWFYPRTIQKLDSDMMMQAVSVSPSRHAAFR